MDNKMSKALLALMGMHFLSLRREYETRAEVEATGADAWVIDDDCLVMGCTHALGAVREARTAPDQTRPWTACPPARKPVRHDDTVYIVEPYPPLGLEYLLGYTQQPPGGADGGE